jgi:hypothetical protein
MKNVRTIAAGALAALGLFACSAPAFAQVHGLSFIIKVAAEPSIGGTSIGAASGTINGSPVSLPQASWTKTHSERSPLFEGGVSVRAAQSADIVAFVDYGHAGATGSLVGQVGNVQLNATLDDYTYWGMEGGVRFGHPSGIGPYATVTAGFRRVSEIQASLTAVALTHASRIYDASVVPVFAIGGGILWGDRSFGIGIEIAVRYAGAPSSPSPLPTTPGGDTVQFASGAGARWSLPVGLVLRF